MADTDNTSGLLGFLGSTINSIATGYGQGLGVSNPIGGTRTPTGQTANPTSTAPGVQGQPGTTPVVATAQILPGVSNTMLFLGGGGVLLGLLLLAAMKK